MLNIRYTDYHRLSQTQIRATVAFDHPTRQASACVAVVGREWWSGYHVAPSMANWLNWGRFLGTSILASRRQEQTGSDTVHRRRGCWNAPCFGRAKDASPAGKAPAQIFCVTCRPGKFSDARAPFGAKKTTMRFMCHVKKIQEGQLRSVFPTFAQHISYSCTWFCM